MKYSTLEDLMKWQNLSFFANLDWKLSGWMHSHLQHEYPYLFLGVEVHKIWTVAPAENTQQYTQEPNK
jgi:hypothetical protein